MSLTLLLQQIINGLAIGGVYAIFALGYTLVFSIMGIINFAHGAVFTLGAYFTYTLMGSQFGFNGLLAQSKLPFGLPFPIALIVGAVLAGGVSVLIERLVFRPLRLRGGDPLLTLVSSLGIAIALVNLTQYLVGAEAYSYPSSVLVGLPVSINLGLINNTPPPLIVRTVQVVIFFVSLLILALLTYLINGTRVGKAMLAISEDPITCNLLGINTDRLIVITFFLSGFIGGIAGTLVGLNVGITGPYFGVAFGLKGLAVIVLGGLGNIPGAVLGGFVIGLGEALVPSSAIGLKDAVAFAVLFIVLLLRPQGILGRAVIQKV
ncbi:MAG: branched-chain amino acid ABC transporter permease [Armatimonadetes bacterium]|nr:branched-chain amino acid ABC transporter permease [Anaerolineae bacterium]